MSLRIFSLYIFYTHLIAIPLLIMLVAYYFFPERLDFASYSALATSIFMTIIGLGLQKKIGFESLRWYITTLFDYRAVAMPLYFITLVVTVVWSMWLVTNFSDRIEYLRIVRGALTALSGDSLAVPDPEKLGRAYHLFPNRREVPLIVAAASPSLIFHDSQKYFKSYMTKFVASADATNESFLAKISDEGGDITRVFFALAILQAENTTSAAQTALDFISTSGQKTIYTEMLEVVMRLEKLQFHSHILKQVNPNDIDKKEIQELNAIRDKFDDIIERMESISDAETFKYAASHLFQEVIDKSASTDLYKAYTMANEAGKKKLYLNALGKYARVFDLRRRFADASRPRWTRPPISLNIYSYYEKKAGGRNIVSNTWINILNNIDKNIIETLDVELYSANIYEKFKSMDYWFVGTPMGAEFREKHAQTYFIELLKKGW